jgi:vacuolar protein sorting-associated protein 35
VKVQKAKAKANGTVAQYTGATSSIQASLSEGAEDGWGTSMSTPAAADTVADSFANVSIDDSAESSALATPATIDGEKKLEKGKEKESPEDAGPVKKFRGVPENVKLFEVFWHQIVELIKDNARPVFWFRLTH